MQTLIALLGFAGLIWYTYETRKMRVLTEERARAEDAPYLKVTAVQYDDIVKLVIRNFGKGPALHMHCWIEQGPSELKRFGTFRSGRGYDADVIGDMQERVHEPLFHNFVEPDGIGSSFNVIVESVDITGRRHQSQTLFIGASRRDATVKEPLRTFLHRTKKPPKIDPESDGY